MRAVAVVVVGQRLAVDEVDELGHALIAVRIHVELPTTVRSSWNVEIPESMTATPTPSAGQPKRLVDGARPTVTAVRSFDDVTARL